MASESEEAGEKDDESRKTNNLGGPVRDDYEAQDEEEEEEEDEEDEPRLNYTSLTTKLKPVYRNGDATSAVLVAGDKMVGDSAFSKKSLSCELRS